MDTLRTGLKISLVLVLLGLVSTSAFEKKTLEGKRARCRNEGEPVPVDDIDKHRCFSCICKNGYVECINSCPKIDECHMIVEDGCCKRCKGCSYKGTVYQSHTEWTDILDPCKVLRCEAGVVTVSNLHCHTPCANPLPPEPGKCCATCPECKINGQIASEDRDVISDDPCLKCRCSKGRMICSKKACPVLQCPITRRHHPPGECCPRCKGTRALINTPYTCTVQTSFFREGQKFSIDKCTNCTCLNNTSICVRGACPILDCAPDLQKSIPGNCCKICVKPKVEELRSQCFYGGVTYEDGQDWKLDACSSCKCHQGQASCAKTRCNTTCAPGSRQVHRSGECCSECVEVEGVCTVYGDPHYKTFDGKMFTFKGIGKYQLTSDCANNSFMIKVANTASNRYSSSTITRRVAVTFGDIRLNLQQRGRVKYNGVRQRVPFEAEGKFHVKKIRDNIEVTLQNGVKLLWNGKSFLEVTVPATYKNKLCGLCGNFNSNVQDDLTMRGGRVVTDKELQSFGSSWCVGKKNECYKKLKPFDRKPCTKHRSENCKFFASDHFAKCESKLSYNKYYKSCKMDMCHCPNSKCYCESLMAYARECERLGVKLSPSWQRDSFCDHHGNNHRGNTRRYNNNNLSQRKQVHKIKTASTSSQDDFLRSIQKSFPKGKLKNKSHQLTLASGNPIPLH